MSSVGLRESHQWRGSATLRVYRRLVLVSCAACRVTHETRTTTTAMCLHVLCERATSSSHAAAHMHAWKLSVRECVREFSLLIGDGGDGSGGPSVFRNRFLLRTAARLNSDRCSIPTEADVRVCSVPIRSLAILHNTHTHTFTFAYTTHAHQYRNETVLFFASCVVSVHPPSVSIAANFTIHAPLIVSRVVVVVFAFAFVRVNPLRSSAY